MSSQAPPLPSTLDVALPLVLLVTCVVLAFVWIVLEQDRDLDDD